MSTRPNNPADIKETVRQEWTGAAPLWKKWNHKSVVQSHAATQLVVQGAELQPGMHVLDLASGTGEPSLSLAKAVGSAGRVVATDLVPEMLEAARENARAQGLSQMEFQVADAEHLPFQAGEFDRVTCRFGLMFFPEVQKALAEIRRVLKPAGRVSFVVWGAFEENPLFSLTLGPFLKHVQMPPAPPDAPGVFRFADQAHLTATLTAAGIRNVRTAKNHVAWPWPGPAEEAWESIRERAAPFKKLVAALPPEKTPEVMHEVLEGLRRFHDGEKIGLTATLISATGAA
ncbi:MAG: class I SAM-dependent methyltransferase [Acidobacteriia bacterium]|nr:class I SAM-dependent methyltransferase [Terriglobia bacterium]